MSEPIKQPMPIHSPYGDVHRERVRAHAKHGGTGMSCEELLGSNPIWLAVITEELGEVAHEMTYDTTSGPGALRKELVQVAAMACAWIDALDNRP